MTALKPNGGDSNPLSRPQAVVLLKSGRRLDLLNPDPQAWTDEDLAAGLARTPRCGANLTSRADPRALFDEPPKHAPAARSEPAIRRDGQRACAICGARPTSALASASAGIERDVGPAWSIARPLNA